MNDGPPVEIWGGVECTVNRVGDVYHDQLERSGHAWRPDDLDRFHAIGLRTLRFPCVWERTAPNGPDRADWRWLDDRLARARRLGMRPIAGLVHHGSGPPATNLLDERFPEGLAAYALAFARRYPWIDAYTPVNEPNTTARFSALYGHWYPHARSDAAYCQALLVQCRAIVESMRAIRSVNPGAQLIQTDDAGSTRSTTPLESQARFETERRWLAWDLLAGRVDEHHDLWRWLRGCGVATRQLDWFRHNACPPDIIGLNYYVTSDRYLDHAISKYPSHTHGGNGRYRYADVEAVRVPASTLSGHASVLQEAWTRFGRPVALTEVHLGCTREEQVRWLASAWRDAHTARSAGADVRAICTWGLLGSHDWNTLVTQKGSGYEPGAFDVRGGVPRRTAVGAAVRDLIVAGDVQHPVLDVPGWWGRDCRLGSIPDQQCAATMQDARPILIAGGGGRLGQALVRHCLARGLAVRALDRAALDLTDAAALDDTMRRLRPWAVINAAGASDVDRAETEALDSWRRNVTPVKALCDAAVAHDVPLLTFSSSLVFDGDFGGGYVESDPVGPRSVFAATKAAAERLALRSGAHVLIVRAGPMFGCGSPLDFVHRGLDAVRHGQRWRVADDESWTPSFVPHMIDAALDLLIDGEYGVWHLTNPGGRTAASFALDAASSCGLDVRLIEPCPSTTLGRLAPRPRHRVLHSERGQLMPSVERALSDYTAMVLPEWLSVDHTPETRSA